VDPSSVLASDEELSDPNAAVHLKGRVLDRDCKPIPDANVHVWYAGGGKSGSGIEKIHVMSMDGFSITAIYTLPGDDLFPRYRGSNLTNEVGIKRTFNGMSIERFSRMEITASWRLFRASTAEGPFLISTSKSELNFIKLGIVKNASLLGRDEEEGVYHATLFPR